MEKMLTIKEAASFLNVSEMSLRRWTNAGKLKCYRLGGKNERRFTKLELENFLRSNENDVPLGFGGITVQDKSHIVHFYKDADESVAAGIGFLDCGLSRGESVLLVSPDSRSSRILAGLRDLGCPVDKLKREGLIVTSDGYSSLNEQLKFITETIATRPYGKGLRLLGDMIWAIEKGWSLDELTRIEMCSNQGLTGNNTLFLCQYDLTHFGAESAMMAMDTHALTIYRGEVKQSPYFIGLTV